MHIQDIENHPLFIYSEVCGRIVDYSLTLTPASLPTDHTHKIPCSQWSLIWFSVLTINSYYNFLCVWLKLLPQ